MWVFLDGHKYSVTGTPYKMTHTAGEVYVTLSGRNVGVYHFFGQEDFTETLIDLSSYFTNDPYYICNGDNKVYVFEKGNTSIEHDEEVISSFVEISTITREVIRHVTLPQEMHCYPTLARQKLWFTTSAVADITSSGRQSVIFFDTTDDTWSTPVEIPGNKQFRPHKIIWAKQSYVYVDGFNENCVYKFNDDTGAYISRIMFNRKPTDLFANDSRELLVSSYNGMVSTINQTTDAYSNDYATNGEVTNFVDDGTYIWSVTPTLQRTAKALTGSPATHDAIEMDGDDKDYSIEAFSETSFNDVIVTPLYNHNEWDVENETIINVTETQHVIVITDNSLFVATTLSDSWDLEEIRPYYITVKATAMIATGPEQYYGETQ